MANTICEVCGNLFGKDGAFMLKGNACCSSCVREQGFIPVCQPKEVPLPTWDEIPEERRFCDHCNVDLRDKEEHACIINKKGHVGIFCDNCIDFI